MKKLLPVLFVMMLFFSVSAFAQSPDLVFTQTEGKYIYCNNHEFIRRSELADNSNENPKYIMNNLGMTPDKYSIFVSHVNHTEKRDENNKIIEAGFDIEIDVLFKAEEDTVIEFTSAGFEVPKNGKYHYNGVEYTYEDAWGCFNCWATYLNMPIRQLDSDIIYSPAEFEPVSITIPAGEKFWMSEILPNYSVVPFFRPMNLMADFEIVSGKCDINVAALKSTGTLGDRSNFSENAAFGSYDRDRQYKGVADSLNEVNTSLSFEVNDYTWSGVSLPVTVYNQKQPEGKETTQWYTHLNPSADQWSADICAESDMLAFKYYDPLKERCYGSNAEKDEDASVWHFDTTHLDTAEYSKEYEKNAQTYVPNRPVNKDDTTEFACNLGNYGVKVNYNISITNSGQLTRYATYKLSTSSNNVVYARDAEGNLINGYALSKGAEESRVADNMVSIKLPPNQTTTFTVTVILTTNYSGGMQNELVINDMPKTAFVYENAREEITVPSNYTGREYYFWENGDLYLSEDNEFNITSAKKVNLPSEIKQAVSGNWNEYSLYYTGSGYILRASLYDGIPYYTVQDFFKTVYFLDENFNLRYKNEFAYYPKAAVSANGTEYIYAGAPLYNDGHNSWQYAKTDMPHWNYGRFSAVLKDKQIHLSTGKTFDKVKYQFFDGKYIDSIGSVYYYADKNVLYFSADGVYWENEVFGEKIKNLDIDKSKLIVNGRYELELPSDDNTIIKINDVYAGFDTKPQLIDGVTYVPLRFLCECLGADLKWDGDYMVITLKNTYISVKFNDDYAYVNGIETPFETVINDNGTAIAPLRQICETLGFKLDVSEGIITINKK